MMEEKYIKAVLERAISALECEKYFGQDPMKMFLLNCPHFSVETAMPYLAKAWELIQQYGDEEIDLYGSEEVYTTEEMWCLMNNNI